jgi:hypothetical protein
MALEKKNIKKDVTPATEETVIEGMNAQESQIEFEAPTQEESIPLSMVEKMMKSFEEKLMSKFNSQMQKMKIAKAEDELNSDLTYVNDLEEDWLENPAVFFAFSLNFSIHGDKKRGMDSEPPQGAIEFKPLIRTKRKSQRGTQVVSVSSVKVHSKEVADYLRGHSQYGIAFYENMDSVMNVDSTWAQKMVEAQQSIGRLSDLQVIARAKQEGIAVGQSPEAMRKQLIEKIAKRQIAQQDNVLYGSLKEANIGKDGRQTIEKVIPNM